MPRAIHVDALARYTRVGSNLVMYRLAHEILQVHPKCRVIWRMISAKIFYCFSVFFISPGKYLCRHDCNFL